MIAGLPFFLNFSGITWVALAGHVAYGLVLGLVLNVIDRSSSLSAPASSLHPTVAR